VPNWMSPMVTSKLLVVGPSVIWPPLVIIACYLTFRSSEDVLLDARSTGLLIPSLPGFDGRMMFLMPSLHDSMIVTFQCFMILFSQK
jgi:hypothetical protein